MSDGSHDRFPKVIFNADSWAVVFKPHGMPTAPLAEGEPGTLLAWFLVDHPDARAVKGKKAIEHGLIHRLDTPTEGLVLIAKTQATYDWFQECQGGERITKRYEALCELEPGSSIPETPLKIESRFRPWGPGGTEVRPVFYADPRYAGSGRDYVTVLESCVASGGSVFRCVCSLTRGYRHQVRAHLASLGLPIKGDGLYNPRARENSRQPGTGIGPTLLLSATGLTFPDPETLRTRAFSLP